MTTSPIRQQEGCAAGAAAGSRPPAPGRTLSRRAAVNCESEVDQPGSGSIVRTVAAGCRNTHPTNLP